MKNAEENKMNSKKTLSLILICLAALSLILVSCDKTTITLSGNSDTQVLQSQINTLQNQLTQSQQNVSSLQSQLQQAQNMITNLQNQLSKTQTITSATLSLVASAPVTLTNRPLYAPGIDSLPIVLKQGERIEGEFTGGIFRAYIQDPNGNTIKDFPATTPSQGVFNITAQSSGTYHIVFQNSDNNIRTAYNLTYTIWHY